MEELTQQQHKANITQGLPAGFNPFHKGGVDYARHRDGYPEQMFLDILKYVRCFDCCWDVATGAGQAAVSMANFFKEVIATDASADQIAHAHRRDNIRYMVSKAEDSGLKADSVDLVSVGKAIHWFYNEEFFDEVKRVLKPGGIMAVFSHLKGTVTEEIDQLVRVYFEGQILKPYIAPVLELLNNDYADIQLPFNKTLRFNSEPAITSKTADQYLDGLRTWSAARTYKEIKGQDPVDFIESDLKALWGTGERKIVHPVLVLIGQKPEEV